MNPSGSRTPLAHPNKTSTLALVINLLLVGIVSLQVWLLTASLDTALGGDHSIVWPAFYASLALFLLGAGLLRYLPEPLRMPRVVERIGPFPRSALAWRTLAISFFALTISFCVWFMWSALVVQLRPAGFNLAPAQLFWLTATPTLLGSLLRIPYGLIVSRFGSRRSFAAVVVILVIPCLGTAFAVSDPRTPFPVLLFWAAVTGIAGAVFSTSSAVVALWFPKQLQGTALGINGMGNIGITVAQFSAPFLFSSALFAFVPWTGGSGTAGTGLHLPNIGLIWIPFILLAALALWFGTEDFRMEPKTLASQLVVCRDKHTWYLSILYFLTFGCVVAMSSSLPLIIQRIFAERPGGTPNPLFWAAMSAGAATIARPLGGWLADKLGASRVTAVGVGIMALGGFSLSQFLRPTDFNGFIVTIIIICVAAGIGNGAIFKLIPQVNPAGASAAIGVVSCIGAIGGFFPPLLLGFCFQNFNSPAWAYTGMALFALLCSGLNAWVYIRSGRY
jgi:NNP family nitrate/nitrite transporter-like MFS transporter